MATHDQLSRARSIRSSKWLASGIAVTLGLTLLGSATAGAAPSADPTNSSDAKTAWEHSSHQAEVAAEQVNGAKQAKIKATAVAAAAAATLTAAKAAAASSTKSANDASAKAGAYQADLNQFANASFRGARLTQFSAMLTAGSADDFLDESTVLDRVAKDTHKTLNDALAAKTAASEAATVAASAETVAVSAKTDADNAEVTAKNAADAAQAKKADLDKAVEKNKALYNNLSEKERLAAIAAAEKVRQESLAAAAAAAAEQAAAEARAAAVASSSSSSSSSSEAAAAAQNNAQAPAQAAAPAASVPDPTTSAAPSTFAAAPAAGSGGDSAGQIAASAAMTKIGFAYIYGADGPSAYDCSGLTTWAWAQAGVSIPRTSAEEANFPEVPLDQLQPGDLVTYYSPVSHVSIYVGNGMVVSAADESLGIIYVPVERGGPNASGHRVPRG